MKEENQQLIKTKSESMNKFLIQKRINSDKPKSNS